MRGWSGSASKITSERCQDPSSNPFPNLDREGYSVESPYDPNYNCIAWAAGDVFRYWWPKRPAYWPPTIPEDTSIETFTSLFEALGYSVCLEAEFEEGYEKVAIYALGGEVQHAARQLQNGKWTSKLGQDIDIEHTLAGLEGGLYGDVVKILKRKLKSS